MSSIGSSRHSGYQRFGASITESFRKRFIGRGQPESNRIVYVDNQVLPGDDVIIHHLYPDNTVVSSKYSLLTFLPKNLFEQFRRVANFYFLCVGIIQFFIDTPVTPLTSVLPLTFVISVTAIKQGYEDWLRHKADSDVNLRLVTVIRNGITQTDCRAMDIRVGDVVKVLANEEFPCDMVMLSSTDPQGLCYVTTANLDGETNLKTHYCLNETRRHTTPDELGQLKARITCKPPVADLYTFEGLLELGGESEARSLGLENLLLRGARLKNTEYIYGCAVYTGRDTKMALNSKFKQVKFSRVERKMNKFLLVFLIILLLEASISAGLKYWYEGKYGVPWYVPSDTAQDNPMKVIENVLAFMVLYNYVIPISLYVTVELQKFLGSLFFGFDCQMYDPSMDERALANTSDLNEELGQVEYLFTDKTGTLTENSMEFRRCCIDSRQFEEIDGVLCERIHPEKTPSPVLKFTSEMDNFMKVLVLCHTLRVDHKMDSGPPNGASSVYSETGREYEYQASSPDEKALVEACCRYGIIYHGMNDDVLEVTFHKTMQRFTLLYTLPFDPMRKRMSVVVQDEKGEYFLLCKGAEVAILDRVVAGDVTTTQRLIDQYAMLGLRTLTIAHRRLTKAEYQNYHMQLKDARRSLSRREEMLSEIYNDMEQQLTLLGATAVEDKLQEQVPETIEALRLAGIKVWVLTGDKEETAVNISHSAGHFNSGMTELRLTQVASKEQCKEQMLHLLHLTTLASSSWEEYSLVVDGKSLKFALSEPEHTKWLYQLCSKCVAVLCCRMSPIQKAKVVALVKNSSKKPVTAAIGDGANDVSMIQEADVGIGIMGKEGRQAVRYSDYAFSKFRFLHRVFLYHGHLYYNRIAVLVQYFFYKNIAWITAQVFYAILSAFSQQSLFDPFCLMFYNMTSTSLPILIYGIFEQHLPQEDLMGKPHLYKKISRNALLSWPQFLKWNLLGLWHCCVFFFGMVFLRWDDVSLFSSGVIVGNFSLGALVYYTCVTGANLKLMLETYYWSLPVFLAYLITLVGLIMLSAVYTAVFWPSWLVSHNDFYRLLGQLMDTPTTWLGLLLLVTLALLPDVVLKAFKDMELSLLLFRKEGQTSVTSTTAGSAKMSSELVSPSQFQHTSEMGLSRSHLTDSLEMYIHPYVYENPMGVPLTPEQPNPPLPDSLTNSRTTTTTGDNTPHPATGIPEDSFSKTDDVAPAEVKFIPESSRL